MLSSCQVNVYTDLTDSRSQARNITRNGEMKADCNNKNNKDTGTATVEAKCNARVQTFTRLMRLMY